MPFQSQAQRAFMYANHPDIAARWEKLTPKDQGLPKKLGSKHPTNPQSESTETWRKGVLKVPRNPKAEFARLSPSPAARHKPAGATPNEQEATKEGGPQHALGWKHGGVHEKMGLAHVSLTRLQDRDIKVAQRTGLNR